MADRTTGRRHAPTRRRLNPAGLPVVRLVRRRVDAVVLRWQARLDSPFADRTLPVLLAGAVFVALAALALAEIRTLQPSPSLASYAQAVERLHDGADEISLVPAGVAAPQRLADLDGSLAMYPLGWLAGFLPPRPTLVVLQAAALALTVLPLWRLARDHIRLRPGAATALVVAFALYSPLHLMHLDGFDPLVLTVPLMMSAVQRAYAGQVYRLFAVALLALACSSRLALVLVGLGTLLTFTVRRRAGAALLAVGLAATAAAEVVAWLGAGDRSFVDGEGFPPGTRSAATVLARALVHPGATLTHLGERRVLVVLAALLLPVALLPMLSLRHLLPVLPLQLAYLLGDLPDAALLGTLAAAATPFVFAATAFALRRTARTGNERVFVPPRLSGALIGVAMLFFVLDSPASPYQSPWDWGGRDRFDAIRLDWTERAAAEPDGVVIAATADMTPLLAHRAVVCTLPRDRYDCPAEPAVYLVDTELDPAIVDAADLRIVAVDGDRRFMRLEPRNG